MSFDISFPRSLGLSDSKSELEELELLPPGGGLGVVLLRQVGGYLWTLSFFPLELSLFPIARCVVEGGDCTMNPFHHHWGGELFPIRYAV
jgi:hypothetical protein